MKKILIFISLFGSLNTFAQTKTKVKKGIASFYADKFEGRRTANGDIYKHNKHTAASNVFPLNSVVTVTNLENNKSVTVIINDRMHKNNKRLIDLSKSAARKLAYISKGLVIVTVELL